MGHPSLITKPPRSKPPIEGNPNIWTASHRRIGMPAAPTESQTQRPRNPFWFCPDVSTGVPFLSDQKGMVSRS